MINPREDGPPEKVVSAFGTTAPLHSRRRCHRHREQKIADLEALTEAHRALSVSRFRLKPIATRLSPMAVSSGSGESINPVADIVQRGPACHKCLRKRDLQEQKT
jgi:hypothetical protein